MSGHIQKRSSVLFQRLSVWCGCLWWGRSIVQIKNAIKQADTVRWLFGWSKLQGIQQGRRTQTMDMLTNFIRPRWS